MHSPESESALIRRAQAGDRTAVSNLFQRFECELFNYLARMLNSHHDAEDALQETFLDAFRALHRYEERGLFKSWLYRIAHRQGLKVVRRRGTVSLDAPELESLPLADDQPLQAEQLVSGERLLEIEAKIQQLPDAEREVFCLRTQSGLSFKEIAEIMDCPLNTALGRMRNATLRLRRWIKRN